MPEKIVQTIIYDAHPAMLRAHPFWFVAYIILIPAFGLGILLLLYWYIETSAIVKLCIRGASCARPVPKCRSSTSAR